MDPSWNMAAYRARTFRPRTYKPAKPVGPALTDPDLLTRTKSAFLDFSCSGCGYVICGCAPDKWCETCDMEVDAEHDVAGCAEAHRARAAIAALNQHATALPPPAMRYQIIDAYVRDVPPPDDASPLGVIATLNRWAEMHRESGFLDLNEKTKARCQSWLVSMEWTKDPTPDSAAVMQLLASWAKEAKPEPKRGTVADFARTIGQFGAQGTINYYVTAAK